MKTSKVILSMAAAAAAGAAIGMLIAPEKGEELQKKILDGARRWLADLASLLVAVNEPATETKNDSEPQHHLEESNMNNERI